ncbi:MAG: CDP-alcohol phosphatidyltransferase family protein [Promethearchaeota archaeon]
MKRLFKGRLINKIATLFDKMGITPNQITIFSLMFPLLAGIFIYLGVFGFQVGNLLMFLIFTELHGVFIFLLILFDGIDGALARSSSSITLFGGFLDSVIDRITDFMVIMGYFIAFLPVFFFDLIPLLIWIFLAILGFYMVSYSRAIAEVHGLKNTNIGFAARSERLMVLTIFSFLLLPAVGLMVVAIISNATALYRIVKYFYMLKKDSLVTD